MRRGLGGDERTLQQTPCLVGLVLRGKSAAGQLKRNHEDTAKKGDECGLYDDIILMIIDGGFARYLMQVGAQICCKGDRHSQQGDFSLCLSSNIVF